MDTDLMSIQEARDLAERAYQAWQSWSKASQDEVDRVCQAMADAAYEASERLGYLAVEETGFGVPLHKKIKNQFGSRNVWESIKNIKTVGVINHDLAKKIYEIAWPVGVVAGLIPSTNPTSTVMFKTLIAVKARNAIVHAPHPSAVKCCFETAKIMAAAAERAGAPKGLIACLQTVYFTRDAGINAPQTHRTHFGDRWFSNGKGSPFCWETCLWGWPGECAGLC